MMKQGGEGVKNRAGTRGEKTKGDERRRENRIREAA